MFFFKKIEQNSSLIWLSSNLSHNLIRQKFDLKTGLSDKFIRQFYQTNLSNFSLQTRLSDKFIRQYLRNSASNKVFRQVYPPEKRFGGHNLIVGAHLDSPIQQACSSLTFRYCQVCSVKPGSDITRPAQTWFRYYQACSGLMQPLKKRPWIIIDSLWKTMESSTIHKHGYTMERWFLDPKLVAYCTIWGSTIGCFESKLSPNTETSWDIYGGFHFKSKNIWTMQRHGAVCNKAILNKI